jgi:hypothetical protein
MLYGYKFLKGYYNIENFYKELLLQLIINVPFNFLSSSFII